MNWGYPFSEMSTCSQEFPSSSDNNHDILSKLSKVVNIVKIVPKNYIVKTVDIVKMVYIGKTIEIVKNCPKEMAKLTLI